MLKKISVTFWIIFVLFIGALVYVSVAHYSEGFRAGTLVKLSKKGYIFGTYEGELNTQTFIDNNSATPGVDILIWSFSVINDDTLIGKLEKAMLEGHRVKLKYKERFYKLPWIGSTEYIVYDMEKLN